MRALGEQANQVPGNTGSGHHQTDIKEKNKRRELIEDFKKIFSAQILQQRSHQRNKQVEINLWQHKKDRKKRQNL